MDLFSNNKPCSILVQLGMLQGPCLTTPTNKSWHKLWEQTMRNKAMYKMNIQRTRISVRWCHLTNVFRRCLQLRWYKILNITWRRWELGNQTKLLHHVQDVFFDNALLNKLGKDMINVFHTEDAVFLQFLPVLGLYRILRKDIRMTFSHTV